MRLRLVIALLLAVICFAPFNAHAARQYLCSGRVQYRPCNQPLHTYKRNVKGSGLRQGARYQWKSEEPHVDSPYAKIVKQTFKTFKNSQGLWKGIVEGNGRVHLRLEIFRDGNIESSRSMGSIFLNNKSTWFSFKSMLPAGQDWRWNISAFAT